MSKWNDATDREINTAVLNKRTGAEFFGSNARYVPNYCHDWGVAGPIIDENSFAMIPPDEFYSEAEWEVSKRFCGVAYHKNPLRAAMIVYLESD